MSLGIAIMQVPKLRRNDVRRYGLLSLTPALALLAACNQPAPPPAPAAAPAAQAAPADSPREREKSFVPLGGCHDANTPKVLKEAGPAPDRARHLWEHPPADKLP